MASRDVNQVQNEEFQIHSDANKSDDFCKTN